MRIRVQLFTLGRIRIQLPKMMRIRIRNPAIIGIFLYWLTNNSRQFFLWAKNCVNFCFVFQQNWEEEAPLYNLDNQVGEHRT